MSSSQTTCRPPASPGAPGRPCAPEPPPRRAGLGSRFAGVWASAAATNAADGVRLAALPLLATALTRDPRLIAGLTVAGTLPWLLLSIPVGVLVDRVDRRSALLFTAAARAVVLGVVTLAVAGGHVTLPLLYLAAFLLGAGEVVFDNVAQTLVPSLVGAGALDRANARLHVSEVAGNDIAGPGLGGLLYAAAAAAPFALGTACYAGAAALVLRLDGTFRPARGAGPGISATAEMVEGVRWLRHQPVLRRLAWIAGAVMLLNSAATAVLVLFAKQDLGLGDAGYGALLSATMGGFLLGGAVAPRLRRHLPLNRALAAVIAVAATSQFAVGLTSRPVATAAALACGTAAFGTASILLVGVRQTLVPDRLLGRVNGLYRFCGLGAVPIGAALGGVLASAHGVRAPFLLGGAAMLVVAAAAARLPRGA